VLRLLSEACRPGGAVKDHAKQACDDRDANVAKHKSTRHGEPHAAAAPLLTWASAGPRASWAWARAGAVEPAGEGSAAAVVGCLVLEASGELSAVEVLKASVVVGVVDGGVPGWHAVELVAPVSEVQWPAEHWVHAVAPKSPFHEPAAHFVHVADALAPANFPGGQGMHDVSLACPSAP